MIKALPEVSVIVLNYNGKEFLKDCFQGLLKTNYPHYEIIMVDNGSGDNSIGYTKQSFPQVQILSLDKNYGFAEGNNRGASIAKGELLAFLNNDTYVDKNWLIELVKPILEDNKIAVCGSKIIFYAHPDIIDFGGGLISPIGTGVHLGFCNRDEAKYNILKYSSHACGASMLIRKDIFQKLVGFDKDYFLYNEELDLCWRCWLAGFRILFIPSSIVQHKGRMTGLSEGNWKKNYYFQINQFSNMVKNFSFFNVIKGLLLSLGFDIFRTFLYTYKKKFANIKAIWEGNAKAIKNLPKLLKKRKIIQSSRAITDKELMRLGLIASLRQCLEIVFKRGGGFLLE